MNDKKILFIIIFSTVIIFVAAIFVFSSSSSSTNVKASEFAKAYTTDPTSFDWGDIPYEGEKATRSFNIKNEGSDTLKLFNVRTSCHCTVARVSIAGIESQNFGMSGVSSWVGEVLPGKEAKLIVVFDQTYHGPQGVGPITRFVSVETNDKSTPKLTFTLTGNVVK